MCLVPSCTEGKEAWIVEGLDNVSNVSKNLDLPTCRIMITSSHISKDAYKILKTYEGTCHIDSVATKRATTVMTSKTLRMGQEPDPQIITSAVCKPGMGQWQAPDFISLKLLST